MNIPTGTARVATLLLAAALAACGGSGDEDSGDPRIRLLNLSTGYTSLDMMTNLESDDDDDDETQAEGVGLETVSEYITLDPDDYTVKLRRTGSGSVLRSFTGEELVEDTINTYVAFGEVGQFGALRIDESLEEADAGEFKLNVANVSSAGLLDVYLTDASTDLDDTTPVLSQVSSAIAAVVADSGTHRLRVTASGDTDDVRLDIPNFTLADRGVATLILTSTQGGMLANAILLPQEGQPTKFSNSKARIRGAVALPNGGSATLSVGGQSILTAQSAGVISNRYAVLESGSIPVGLGVNGVAVPVPNVTLAAGADYTLMIWANANGPTVTLVTDDNRLPSGGAGATKIRLLNGMSTLASPLTLAIDFSPVIEGTAVGTVSNEEEVSPGTDRQFDISNTNTAANVLSRTYTLQGSSVYTYFLTDNGGTPIGVLRRDR